MANKTIPTWIQNKKKYDNEYQKQKMTKVSTTLQNERDAERIETWKSIPKKADFMRQVLDMYAAGELEIK